MTFARGLINSNRSSALDLVVDAHKALPKQSNEKNRLAKDWIMNELEPHIQMEDAGDWFSQIFSDMFSEDGRRRASMTDFNDLVSLLSRVDSGRTTGLDYNTLLNLSSMQSLHLLKRVKNYSIHGVNDAARALLMEA